MQTTDDPTSSAPVALSPVPRRARRMRVIHVVKTNDGAEWARRLVREQRHRGHEVDLVVPAEGSLAERARADGTPVHVLGDHFSPARPAALARAVAGLGRIVEAERPDFLQLHHVVTALSARLALRRVAPRRVFMVHGPLHLEHRPSRWLDLATAGEGDYWITTCRAVRDMYLRFGVPPGRLFQTYTGTDVDLFRRETARARARIDLRSAYGIPASTAIVGMVAYIYAPKAYLGHRRGIKGHEDLIDAVRLLRERGRDCALVFVGGAWVGAVHYEERLMRHARRALGDRAIFLGNRPDVGGLYVQFDVAVHPSHSENLGGAPESLMLGVPTVATSVGGLPELVQDGRTGWLAPPKDPVALADAIEAALSNPAEARRRSEEGERLARRMFDIRSMADSVLGFYDAILAR
jgi:glycosyltransferase involved in cell wall biosynthesis